jgi:hypothetical protein
MRIFQNNLIKLVFILFAFPPSTLFAQPINLVPNPSFEVYDTCPNLSNFGSGPITVAIPWFQPNLYASSTDYFNICDTLINSNGVPNNFMGYQQAYTGNGYAGIALLYGLPGTTREYLEVPLLDSLKLGKKYCVSFYLVSSNLAKYITGTIGCYFSNSIVLYNSSTFGLLPITPQISFNSINLFSDTLNWIEVKGDFISNGGESFLTIGNFNSNINSTYSLVNYGNKPGAYYYIDDVSVYLCDSTVSLDEKNLSEIILYPNPASDLFKFKTKNNTLLNGKVNVSNTIGGIIYSNNSNNVTELEIDISNWSNGIYYLTFESVYGTIRRMKLVKAN